MLYIIFEGPDRVGKTSTRALVHKIRNQKDNALDRFIGSMIVYGNIFGRYSIVDEIKQYDDEKKFVNMFETSLIYLYAPAETIIERIENDNHTELDKELIEKELKEFDKYFERTNIKNKIKIDTSKFSQEEVVEKIIVFLNNIEKNDYYNDCI
jgi:thymidylate kinase